MMRRASYFLKIIIAIVIMLQATSMTSCAKNSLVSSPTLDVPTDDAMDNPLPTMDIEVTPTPNLEESIIFNDLNLENAVRNLIGKNIGTITRSDVENVKELSARVRGISNIEALKYFTNLEVLDLYGNRVADLSPLASLTSLKKLNIGKNYNILSAGSANSMGMDISSLKGLLLLEELDLSDNMISDLSGLSSLSNLKTIILKNNRIDDLSPLSGCKSLVYLDISSNFGINSDNTVRGISDLSPLFGINTIESILASDNIISNVDGMEGMVSLKYIDLSKNSIQFIDSLSKVPNLQSLILKSNYITDINSLRNNATIRYLDVSMNMISDFKCINTMTSLKQLVWEGNNILDYKPIEKFESELSKNENNSGG